MSRTLFWYLFKDLLRIFLLAALAIAGIMSFGGLLRPLTHQGLDASQVGQMLLYLMPAMTTYSLPIAALFATTIVYGRLSADNELTACRAAGMSHLAVATPAMVLGLTVSITSLLFLCFVVPAFTLKVERVVKSNVARLLANQIERKHELKVGKGKDEVTIFAQSAHVGAVDPEYPDDQSVTLVGPMIIEGQRPPGETRDIAVPRQFHMARQATIYLRQVPETESISAEIILEGGTSFPREATGRFQGGIEATRIGPFSGFESPIRENTKFMDIVRLKDLYRSPGKSQRVRRTVNEFIRDEQAMGFAELVLKGLHGPQHRCVFTTGNEVFELHGRAFDPEWNGRELRLSSRGGERHLRLTRRPTGGGAPLDVDWSAARIHLRLLPDRDKGRMVVLATLEDALNRMDRSPTPRDRFAQRFAVSMPQELRDLPAQRTPEYYQSSTGIAALGEGRFNALMRELVKLTNGITGEMHARVAFAVSCLILVLVGCALGMMFRSGNFLSAFAVSVAPALLTITLIGAGQQTAERLPWVVTGPDFRNPLPLGLALIWGGNIAVSIIATTLLWRLQKR